MKRPEKGAASVILIMLLAVLHHKKITALRNISKEN
jgi:hypothetical protein